MKRAAIVGLAFLLLTGFATAQNTGNNVDTVILASTANYPDAMISAAPANKLGIPVLLTDKDQLTPSTEKALNRLDPSEVVVVGGPAVVSESLVNNQIEANTTRLWGMTQVGTSIEVADYFWSEGSDEAVIVQYPQNSDQGYRLLGAVKNEVQDEDEPILVSKEGTLSASVISAVERLGATEVEVYSTDAVNVTEDLESSGVQEVDLEEAELRKLTEQVENRTTTGLKNKTVEGNQTLVIVAAANFRQAISAPAVPHSNSFVVGGSEQVTEAVELVRDTDAERILVAGKPDLARQIADRIESETDRTVDRVSGENAADVAANLTTRNENEWRELQQKLYGDWKQKVNSAPGIKKAANRTLTEAESEIDSNSTQEARDLLAKAQDAFKTDDYFRAKQLASRALSAENIDEFETLDREEIKQRAEQEREDFQEAAKEIRELSQETAKELKEAETIQERLEIIQEYRKEHQEAVEELRKEAGEKRVRKETEGERFEQKPGDSGTVGSSSLSLETEGSELKAEARYVAPTLGYTRDIQVTRTEDTVSFNFQLNSPEGPAGQQVTEYRLEKRTDMKNGSFTAKVTLTVDGEQVNSLEKQIEVPSVESFEKESGDSEAEKENESSNQNTVKYTGSGFVPKTIKVETGEEVTWKNTASRDMWVAVDEHPSHTRYDGTSRGQHCPDPDNSVFDQCKSGSEYSFSFEEPGTYDYHNHRFAGHSGTVVVE